MQLNLALCFSQHALKLFNSKAPSGEVSSKENICRFLSAQISTLKCCCGVILRTEMSSLRTVQQVRGLSYGKIKNRLIMHTGTLECKESSRRTLKHSPQVWRSDTAAAEGKILFLCTHSSMFFKRLQQQQNVVDHLILAHVL